MFNSSNESSFECITSINVFTSNESSFEYDFITKVNTFEVENISIV